MAQFGSKLIPWTAKGLIQPKARKSRPGPAQAQTQNLKMAQALGRPKRGSAQIGLGPHNFGPNPSLIHADFPLNFERHFVMRFTVGEIRISVKCFGRPIHNCNTSLTQSKICFADWAWHYIIINRIFLDYLLCRALLTCY